MDAADQRTLDQRMIELGRTPTKAGSAPTRCWPFHSPPARAEAHAEGRPLYRNIGGEGACVLPVPMMNIVNGGAHSDAPSLSKSS
jgi:enolase